MKKIFFAAALAATTAMPGAAIAQSEPAPLTAYGELASVEDVALSPGGRIAMLTTSGGRRVIVVTNADLKPTNVVEAGDLKLRGLSWAGDEFLIVTRTDTQDLGERFMAKNSEFTNAMIVPADGGKLDTVFGSDRSMMHAIFGNYGYRKIDNRWYGFFAGWPMSMGQRGYYFDPSAPQSLYKVDLATNKATKLVAGERRGVSEDFLIDDAGNPAARMRFENETGKWELFNSAGREIASGREKDGWASVVSFGTTGKTAIYAVSPEKGESAYYEVPLDGSAAATKRWDASEVDEFFFDKSKLIGFRPDSEDDDTPEFFVPATKEKILPVVQSFDKINGTIQNWTPDLSRVLVYTSGKGDSGTYYLADTVAKGASVLAKARPAITPDRVGPTSLITYKAGDGTEIEGILTLPPGKDAKNLPFIMLPHGGPRAHDTTDFDWWAQAFASRGYAVLQPNFRGSTGYGLDFMHAGDGEWGKKMQSDLSDGMDFLAKQGTIDPKRACIMGASYGGYAALAGVTIEQGRYKCSVAVAGVSDLSVFFEREYNEAGRSRDLRKGWLEMMGPRDQLKTVSPRSFVQRTDAPVLLIHGVDDTVVPYEQSKIMADSLKNAGKPYELVTLDGEDHWLSRSETRQKMLEEAMRFIAKYNPAN